MRRFLSRMPGLAAAGLLLCPALLLADAPEETTTPVPKPSADPLDALPKAEPLSFKAGLEKAEVGLAEPVVLTVEVKHPQTETYRFPEGVGVRPFGLRGHKQETHGTDPRTTTFRLTLQAFEVGEVELPAIRLIADTPDGPRLLEIPPQKLKVTGVIDPAQGEPRMREDTRPLPTLHRFVWWPLAALLAAALGVLAWLWWRKRKARPAAAPLPVPRKPPDVEALLRLEALEREQLVSQGLRQAYYFRLTEIVRDYLGRRYGFDALELTTSELLAELIRRPTPGLLLDDVARFLNEGDVVKFARREASDGECKQSMDTARLLIERSRPVPEVQGKELAS